MAQLPRSSVGVTPIDPQKIDLSLSDGSDAEDSEPKLIKAGLLYKKGRHHKAYKLRWFQLWDNKQVSYFTDKNLSKRKGDISLMEYTSDHIKIPLSNTVDFKINVISKVKAFAFEISPGAVSSRTWCLAARDERERLEWIEAIGRVADAPIRAHDFRKKTTLIPDAFVQSAPSIAKLASRGTNTLGKFEQIERQLYAGQFVAAQKKAQKLLRSDEINPQYYDLLGRITFAQQRVDVALTHHRKACEHMANFKNIADNTKSEFLVRYTDALLQKNDIDAAAKKIEEARQLSPRHPYVLACSGRVATAQLRYDEAVTYFTQALKLCKDGRCTPPQEFYIRDSCKDYYYITQQWGGALDEAKRLLNFDINNKKWQTYFFMGKIYRELCRFQQARTMLTEAIKLNRNCFLLHCEYLLLQMDWTRVYTPVMCSEYFTNQIEHRFGRSRWKSHWYYSVIEARVCVMNNNVKSAQKLFDDILNTNTDLEFHPLESVMSIHVLHYYLAMFYQTTNQNYRKAEPYWKGIIEKYAPNWAIAHYYYHKCLFNNGEYEKSLHHLNAAYQLNPHLPVIKNNYDTDKNSVDIAITSLTAYMLSAQSHHGGSSMNGSIYGGSVRSVYAAPPPPTDDEPPGTPKYATNPSREFSMRSVQSGTNLEEEKAAFISQHRLMPHRRSFDTMSMTTGSGYITPYLSSAPNPSVVPHISHNPSMITNSGLMPSITHMYNHEAPSSVSSPEPPDDWNVIPSKTSRLPEGTIIESNHLRVPSQTQTEGKDRGLSQQMLSDSSIGSDEELWAQPQPFTNDTNDTNNTNNTNASVMYRNPHISYHPPNGNVNCTAAVHHSHISSYDAYTHPRVNSNNAARM